jgi:hypothetical protein
VIRHRNHLGVLSNSIPSNAAGSFTNDYSVLANSYKAVGAPSDPMMLLSGGLKYGLWAGDANKNGIVNGTDVSVIKLATASLDTGYLLSDINLSNSINGTDVSLTKITLSLLGSGGTPTIANSISKERVQTNIPDRIVEQP